MSRKFLFICKAKNTERMTPVKLNVYISYVPDDRKAVEKLRDWLYPMRDEVNIWFNDPPKPPKPLPLPWELIASVLPIFNARDFRQDYARVDYRRKERAHIYLFMTSYKSLIDANIDNDISLAVSRRIEGDWLSPRIYPVILAPSLWKERSRLARFQPIGAKKTLVETKPEEEGYLEIAEQLSKVIKDMQRDLNEAKYARARIEGQAVPALPETSGAQPYLGGEEDLLEFRMPPQIYPPEWLGWMIILVLFFSFARGMQGDKDKVQMRQNFIETERPVWQEEYKREHPMVQPAGTVPLRPAE